MAGSRRNFVYVVEDRIVETLETETA